MKYEDRELLEKLAAEYALGTLRGRARLRFERICKDNKMAQAAVKRWEDRFVNMLSAVKVEQPSPQVWNGIERRLGLRNQTAEKSASSMWSWLGSRWSAAAFAGVTALAIGVGVFLQQSASRVEPIGTFAQADRGDIWRVSSSKDGARLVIEATDQVTPDAQHAYELWALPEGSPPVSLGLLPKNGSATLALNAAQRAALGSATKIAVSLEPLGGSPTGAPTGPVLHVTDVMKLS